MKPLEALQIRVDHEIAENERGLRGPVADDPYWVGRLNGLLWTRAAIASAIGNRDPVK
jgi:hypothetical protein